MQALLNGRVTEALSMATAVQRCSWDTLQLSVSSFPGDSELVAHPERVFILRSSALHRRCEIEKQMAPALQPSTMTAALQQHYS